MRLFLLFVSVVCVFGQIPKPGGASNPGGGGGGGGTTSVSGLTDLKVTKLSDTIISIAAGQSDIGGVITDYPAATATISPTVSTSVAYVYIDSSGILSVGHNGSALITCSNCTTITGVTDFPAESKKLATVPYTSNVWGAPVEKRVLGYQFSAVNGGGLSITQNAGGRYIFAADPTPIAPTIYLPHGVLGVNLGAAQNTFVANETRWTGATFRERMTFTGMGVTARLGIGGGKGLRFAVADSAGNIVAKTNVNTTCAGQSTCRAAFPSPVTLDAGNYYIGITTDSTAFYTSRPTLIADEEGQVCQAVEIATPPYAGKGTNGTGTGASVDFPATMGTLTSWSCDNALNTFLSGYIDVYFHN